MEDLKLFNTQIFVIFTYHTLYNSKVSCYGHFTGQNKLFFGPFLPTPWEHGSSGIILSYLWKTKGQTFDNFSEIFIHNKHPISIFQWSSISLFLSTATYTGILQTFISLSRIHLAVFGPIQQTTKKLVLLCQSLSSLLNTPTRVILRVHKNEHLTQIFSVTMNFVKDKFSVSLHYIKRPVSFSSVSITNNYITHQPSHHPATKTKKSRASKTKVY